MRIPTIEFDKLWHVGDLNVDRKYANGESQEGNLLSMSRCPSAWQQIARLGGNPLYQYSAQQTLLDMMAVEYPKTKAARQLKGHIISWGREQGLLRTAMIWHASYYDDELEQQCTVSYELDERDRIDEDSYESIVEAQVDIATEKLCAIHHQRFDPTADGVGFAIIEWARAHASTLVSGVYWNEIYDPIRYSAPRAGLFDPKTEAFERVDHFPTDEESLIRGGKTRWPELDTTTQYTP